MNLLKHIKIAQMSAQNLTNGGTLYLLLSYLLKIVYLLPLLLLWRTLTAGGVDGGMSLPQLLAYTYLGAILSDVLVVRTPASDWFYEGLFVSLYQRPANVLVQLASLTVGGWIPQLLLFTLPMIIAAPLFGVSLMPHSLWFAPSLLLCILLGFAVDFLFSCLTIRLQHASWLVYVIRSAVTSLLSGTVIPFAVLPGFLGKVFEYLPFGSLAAAPLSVYVGLERPYTVLLVQVAWNIILWPLAILYFRKMQERMVSFGG